MNDDTITKLVYGIDDIFAKLIETSQVSPLTLSSIVLARLIRMNDACDTGGKFRQILYEAYKKEPVEQNGMSLH